MINMLKIFLGMRGTWFWACRQMIDGKTVYRLRDSGIVKFTYEKGIRKVKALIWWETSIEPHEWGISMEDVFATDFMLVHENMNFPKIHRQTQMKCDSKALTVNEANPAPKSIKQATGNTEQQIQEFMKRHPDFVEQAASYGKRFGYRVNNVEIAHVWFKYALNGWNLIFYDRPIEGRINIDSVDKLKAVLKIENYPTP